MPGIFGTEHGRHTGAGRLGHNGSRAALGPCFVQEIVAVVVLSLGCGRADNARLLAPTGVLPSCVLSIRSIPRFTGLPARIYKIPPVRPGTRRPG